MRRVRLVKIPTEKIIRIDFPKQLGGKHNIAKILKRIWQLSKELVPKFHMDAMSENKNVGFDFNLFNATKYIEIAKITKKIGWNQRQLSGDNITEYYAILRILRERKSQALIRELIFKKLNDALNGSILNFETKVTMENIPSVADIEKQEELLIKGDISFMDLLKATNI